MRIQLHIAQKNSDIFNIRFFKCTTLNYNMLRSIN